MRVKEVTVSKKFKIGLPNYSNIEAGCSMTVELKEGEMVSWDDFWDEINQQLSIQTYGIDPTWITKKELKDNFKIIIKAPKASKDTYLKVKERK